MLRDELLEVIDDFEKALARKKMPTFRSLHRAEQALRILKVDYYDFYENESKRASDPETRAKWEQWSVKRWSGDIIG